MQNSSVAQAKQTAFEKKLDREGRVDLAEDSAVSEKVKIAITSLLDLPSDSEVLSEGGMPRIKRRLQEVCKSKEA